MSSPLALWLFTGDDPSDHTRLSLRHARDDTMETAARAELADPDQAIGDAIRAGDSAAFDRLVTQYWGPLCAFAAGYVKDVELAKELVADVFAAVWERRATWHVVTTVEAYLFGAVRNRARTAHRDAMRRARLLANRHDEIVPTAAPAADTTLEDDDLVHRVREAVDRLPERLREATILRWERHMAYAEISGVLNVSEAAARQLVSRALRVLREQLRV